MSQSDQLRVFFVRHGMTTWNQQRRWQGQVDTELSEEGIQQAADLAAQLTQIPIHYIYSSDLRRAKQTAETIRTTLARAMAGAEPLGRKIPDLILDERLREVNFGIATGLTTDAIREKIGDETLDLWFDLEHPDMHLRLPEGESRMEIFTRLQGFFSQQFAGMQKEANCVVVSHGGALRNFFKYALGQGCFPGEKVKHCQAYEAIYDLNKQRWLPGFREWPKA